ncbi:MAG TPA: OsmC family protein [Acidimicrobiales bacterium]|nr:OsmC family protein [Acidimicrobiales bacterium]
MTITDNAVDNGVNLEALKEARTVLGEQPELARFEWRVTNTWKWGTHSVATVEKFGGMGGEQTHKQPFAYDIDHPELFAAEDNGATPVEMVLVGLAGCLTAGVASIAQLRGIQLRSVTAVIEGDMDVRGSIGVDPEVRNGFSAVRVRYQIDADDASREDLEAVLAQSQKRSPVYDLLTSPTIVSVELA